ncbi:MAG TPA: hypothetical protein VH416_04000 [Gaiellaceae bacterium]|jgi:hypothetical protein
MRRISRDHLWLRCTVLVVVLGVVFVCGWAATGFNSGVVFALAIGAGTAVAIFSDTRSTCSPRFLRRRE